MGEFRVRLGCNLGEFRVSFRVVFGLVLIKFRVEIPKMKKIQPET